MPDGTLRGTVPTERYTWYVYSLTAVSRLWSPNEWSEAVSVTYDTDKSIGNPFDISACTSVTYMETSVPMCTAYLAKDPTAESKSAVTASNIVLGSTDKCFAPI